MEPHVATQTLSTRWRCKDSRSNFAFSIALFILKLLFKALMENYIGKPEDIKFLTDSKRV